MSRVIEVFADVPQPDGSTARYSPYWYKRDKCFKVLERSGDESNKDENAIRVFTVEELAQKVDEGFAVRMSPDGLSPCRISPDRITVRRGE